MSDTGVVSPSGTRIGTLVAGCLAVGVAQAGLVLPAVLNGPMQQALHVSGAQLSWISDAFLVPIAMLSLTMAVLGDLYGRRHVLVGGGVVMAVGYLVAGTAATPTLVIVGHALCGIGAAALFPSSLAVVSAITTEAVGRSRALAAWTASLSTGAVVSPLIAGVIVQIASYHWVFVTLAVFAAISAVASALLAENSRAPEGRALDWPGQLAIAVSVFALLYAVIEGPIHGWVAPDVIGGFALCALTFVAFLRIESRTPTPMLRLDLFRIPAFAVSAVVAVIGMFGFLGGMYALSIRLGVIERLSPLAIAMPFVVIPAMSLVVWPMLAKALRAVPRWLLLVVGLLCSACGQVLFAVTPVATSLLSTLPILILLGIGFVLLISALTACMINAVPVRLAGMASATASVVRDLGQTFAPAILGTLISIPLGQTRALVSGNHDGFLVAATACLFAAVIAGIFLRGHETD